MLPFHIRLRKEPLTNSNSQVPHLTFTGHLGEEEGEGEGGGEESPDLLVSAEHLGLNEMINFKKIFHFMLRAAQRRKYSTVEKELGIR